MVPATAVLAADVAAPVKVAVVAVAAPATAARGGGRTQEATETPVATGKGTWFQRATTASLATRGSCREMSKEANAVSLRRLPQQLDVTEEAEIVAIRRFPQPWVVAKGADVTPSRHLPQQLAAAQAVDAAHPPDPVDTTRVMRPLLRLPLVALLLAQVVWAQAVLAVLVGSVLRRPRVPVNMRIVSDAKPATQT